MVGCTCVPYFLAILCFLRAGKHYADFKTCLMYCKKETLSNINIEQFMDMKEIQRNTHGVTVKRSMNNALLMNKSSRLTL